MTVSYIRKQEAGIYQYKGINNMRLVFYPGSRMHSFIVRSIEKDQQFARWANEMAEQLGFARADFDKGVLNGFIAHMDQDPPQGRYQVLSRGHNYIYAPIPVHKMYQQFVDCDTLGFWRDKVQTELFGLPDPIAEDRMLLSLTIKHFDDDDTIVIYIPGPWVKWVTQKYAKDLLLHYNRPEGPHKTYSVKRNQKA